MTDPTPETTPTRDEAVRLVDNPLANRVAAIIEASLSRHGVDGIDFEGTLDDAADILALFPTSAPAPASGGVDVVAELDAFYQGWLARWRDRLASPSPAATPRRNDPEDGDIIEGEGSDPADFLVPPAATPVSEAEPVAKRWLVEETLPGGSIVWSCFEHEHMARQMVKNKLKYGDETVTLTPLYALAKPAGGDVDDAWRELCERAPQRVAEVLRLHDDDRQSRRTPRPRRGHP